MRELERCPRCHCAIVSKVIYAGFPMKLCWNSNCQTCFGFWSWVMEYLPFNGVFFVYGGSYLRAAWGWLFREES